MVTNRKVEVTPLLQALADPTRLGVVQLLSTGPRRAGELADVSCITAAAISKQRRVLLAARGVAAAGRRRRAPPRGRPGAVVPAPTRVGGRATSVARSAPSAMGRATRLVQTTRGEE